MRIPIWDASMARQVRIQYPGAIYHVLARGDRKEAIFEGDRDREYFLKTLGEACGRSGFVVHAYVLLSNHYHLLLETPEANLSEGMGWLQNTFTRRMNVVQGRWGHLFGGRYKSLVTEGGDGFWALMDYIHLNPVRAGLIHAGGGWEDYRWSSLPGYLGPARKRPHWLETRMGFEVVGVSDSVGGRREFRRILEGRVDWGKPGLAGLKFAGGGKGASLDVGLSVRRGWMLGSEAFRERLLEMVEMLRPGKGFRSSNGYHGPEIREHGQARAEELIKFGLRHFGLSENDLHSLAKGDRRKALVAALIHSETSVRLDWISERLAMGSRAGCCRLIRRAKEEWKSELMDINRR